MFQILNSSFPFSIWLGLLLCDVFALNDLKSKGISKNTSDYIFNNGRVTTVCFDKTGTLTKNSFTLKEIILEDGQETMIA